MKVLVGEAAVRCRVPLRELVNAVEAGRLDGWVMGGELYVAEAQLEGFAPSVERITLAEWAQRQGTNVQHAYFLARTRRIDAERLAGRWYVPVDDGGWDAAC